MNTEERARLEAFLAVPSISASADHGAEMRQAAEMVVAEIERAGGSAEIVDEGGHPLVIGRCGPEGGPRVLLYGHYDVQPVGDPDDWESPPFTPTERGEHLYARGASDDKGNVWMLLVAVQRLVAAGELDVGVEFLIEGEEESGGDSAEKWLRREAPACDLGIVFDAPMIAVGAPSYCVGLRGLVYRRVTLTTGTTDGHSGLYGGAGLNAVHALMSLLGAVAPRNGRLIAPLEAGVAEPDAAEVAGWDALPAGADLLADVGLRPADPAAAAEFHRRTTAAPSLDVHALEAGEIDLVKTNLPVTARATLSLRVAPGQDAPALGETLDGALRGAVPAGADLEIERLNEGEASLLDGSRPAVARAVGGMEEALDLTFTPVRVGGSIPIIACMEDVGIPTLLTGFGLPDDAIHGANERIRVEHLGLGTRAAMGALRALGGPTP